MFFVAFLCIFPETTHTILSQDRGKVVEYSPMQHDVHKGAFSYSFTFVAAHVWNSLQLLAEAQTQTRGAKKLFSLLIVASKSHHACLRADTNHKHTIHIPRGVKGSLSYSEQNSESHLF